MRDFAASARVVSASPRTQTSNTTVAAAKRLLVAPAALRPPIARHATRHGSELTDALAPPTLSARRAAGRTPAARPGDGRRRYPRIVVDSGPGSARVLRMVGARQRARGRPDLDSTRAASGSISTTWSGERPARRAAVAMRSRINEMFVAMDMRMGSTNDPSLREQRGQECPRHIIRFLASLTPSHDSGGRRRFARIARTRQR